MYSLQNFIQCSVWTVTSKFYKYVAKKFVATALIGKELKRVKMKVLWVLPAAGEEKISFFRISGETMNNYKLNTGSDDYFSNFTKYFRKKK